MAPPTTGRFAGVVFAPMKRVASAEAGRAVTIVNVSTVKNTSTGGVSLMKA